MAEAAPIAVAAARAAADALGLELVRFVLFSAEADLAAFEAAGYLTVNRQPIRVQRRVRARRVLPGLTWANTYQT